MEVNFDAVKQKAGPLPVWGWVVGIVGAWLAYEHYAKAKAGASTAAATPAMADTAADTTTGGLDYGPALITAEYGLTNQLGILDSNVASNTGAVGSNTTATVANTTATTANTAATVAQHPSIKTKAQLRAIYDNYLGHLKLAQQQYNKAPNAKNAALVHQYQASTVAAQKAYLSAPATP